MIRHVALFTWIPEATDEQKQVTSPITMQRATIQYEI
jgi:hypothetical protein